MRRGFVMMAGLAVAIPAAMITLVAALLVVLAAHGSGSSLPVLILGMLRGLAWSQHPDRLLAVALRATAEAMAIVCCAPVICAALVGQVAQIGRPLYYAGLTAALTVLLPLAAENASAAFDVLSSPLALGSLLVTGAVSGLCYGAIAAPTRPYRAFAAHDDQAPRTASSSRNPPVAI